MLFEQRRIGLYVDLLFPRDESQRPQPTVAAIEPALVVDHHLIHHVTVVVHVGNERARLQVTTEDHEYVGMFPDQVVPDSIPDFGTRSSSSTLRN